MFVYCPHCGAQNKDTARFCLVCGGALAVQSAAPSWPVPAAGATAAPYPSLPVPFGASAVSSRLVAAGGQEYFLIAGATTRIGRSPDNDIVLANSEISGYHAQIEEQGGLYRLTDLQSHNGTRVNNQPVFGSTHLQNGDQIAFASERFTFRTTAAALTTMMGHSTGAIPLPGTAGQPRSAWDSLFGPQVMGVVTHSQPAQQESPPTDPARVLVMIAVTLGFLGLALAFILAAVTAGILLLLCGGAALLFILPLLFAPLQLLYSGLMTWLRDDKPGLAIRFSVYDEIKQTPVDVLLFLKQGSAGSIQLGDRVHLWGRRTGGGAMRASRARVVERGGGPADIPLAARKPWPLWVGLAALAAVIGGLAYLAITLNLI
jgi:pSer/pThr/pTyr-binding forkhead associated (FHA) protein